MPERIPGVWETTFEQELADLINNARELADQRHAYAELERELDLALDCAEREAAND